MARAFGILILLSAVVSLTVACSKGGSSGGGASSASFEQAIEKAVAVNYQALGGLQLCDTIYMMDFTTNGIYTGTASLNTMYNFFSDGSAERRTNSSVSGITVYTQQYEIDQKYSKIIATLEETYDSYYKGAPKRLRYWGAFKSGGGIVFVDNNAQVWMCCRGINDSSSAQPCQLGL